jgi:hypothetical protein
MVAPFIVLRRIKRACYLKNTISYPKTVWFFHKMRSFTEDMKAGVYELSSRLWCTKLAYSTRLH